MAVAQFFITGIVLDFIIAKTFGTSWLVNPGVGASITIVVGYALSCVFKSNKSTDEIRQYTAKSLREKIVAEGKGSEDGVSVVPFKVDKYGVALLSIFVVQYAILFIIR